MSVGLFYKKGTCCVVEDKVLENELPDVFLMDSMKIHPLPKLSYITVLGKIACGESSYVDRDILNIILADDYMYRNAIEFLCDRYTFRKYTNFNYGVVGD